MTKNETGWVIEFDKSFVCALDNDDWSYVDDESMATIFDSQEDAQEFASEEIPHANEVVQIFRVKRELTCSLTYF